MGRFIPESVPSNSKCSASENGEGGHIPGTRESITDAGVHTGGVHVKITFCKSCGKDLQG